MKKLASFYQRMSTFPADTYDYDWRKFYASECWRTLYEYGEHTAVQNSRIQNTFWVEMAVFPK